MLQFVCSAGSVNHLFVVGDFPLTSTRYVLAFPRPTDLEFEFVLRYYQSYIMYLDTLPYNGPIGKHVLRWVLFFFLSGTHI